MAFCSIRNVISLVPLYIMAILAILAVCQLVAAAVAHEDTCYNKFEYEFNVLQKLVDHEQQIASLLTQLKDAKQTISELQKHEAPNPCPTCSASGNSVSSSYIRWGRTVCPDNATLVYKGYAAGSHWTHKGAAANYLCLPTNPDWNKYTDDFQSYGRVYGAEYETTYNEAWKYLHEYDVPCALCRIPSCNVEMIPAKNVCPHDYVLEYSGYLMAGAWGHEAASEYVCVDGNPETIPDSSADKNGKLFYHVEAECGSLKCPPYVNGRELTCAVCSFAK